MVHHDVHHYCCEVKDRLFNQQRIIRPSLTYIKATQNVTRLGKDNAISFVSWKRYTEKPTVKKLGITKIRLC